MSTDNTNENVSDNVLNRRQTIPRAPNNGQTSGVHMRLVDDLDVRGNKRKATNAADASDTSNKTQLKRRRSLTKKLQTATISEHEKMLMHLNYLESAAQIQSVNGELQNFMQTMVKMGRGLMSQVEKLEEEVILT